MKYKQGFTLVEVMIAVAIVGILSALAFPSYRQYIRNSEFKTCAKHIMPLRLIATNLIVSNNSSVAGITAATLGFADGDECSNTDVNVTGEVLTMKGDAGGKTFQMQRSDVASGGVWSCRVDTVALTSCSDLQ